MLLFVSQVETETFMKMKSAYSSLELGMVRPDTPCIRENSKIGVITTVYIDNATGLILW